MNNLQKEIVELKIKHGFIEKHSCSQDEIKQYEKLKTEGLPLPDNIMMQFNGSYVRLCESDVTKDEINELLQLRKIEYERIQVDYLKRQDKQLDTIKNGMTFFVVLTIVSLCIGVYFLISGML